MKLSGHLRGLCFLGNCLNYMLAGRFVNRLLKRLENSGWNNLIVFWHRFVLRIKTVPEVEAGSFDFYDTRRFSIIGEIIKKVIALNGLCIFIHFRAAALIVKMRSGHFYRLTQFRVFFILVFVLIKLYQVGHFCGSTLTRSV